VKQLEKDPWDGISQRYSSGDIVDGSVTNITDFGIFLELTEGIEGLIHVSEIDRNKAGKLSQFANVGDSLRALIISIDERERKIGLSLKALEKKTEKEDLEEYVTQQPSSESSLGEVLESKEAQADDTEEKGSPEPPSDEPVPEEDKEASDDSK
jgi:small subunit ribosomal protein S1